MKTATRFILFIIMTAFIHQGCSSTATSEQGLEKRAHANMAAQIKDDWKLVYTFLDETYRKETSEDDFVASRGAQIQEYHIESIKIDPSKKKALVLVKYNMTIRGPLSFDVKDVKDNQTWIVENNNWFLTVKPLGGGMGFTN